MFSRIMRYKNRRIVTIRDINQKTLAVFYKGNREHDTLKNGIRPIESYYEKIKQTAKKLKLTGYTTIIDSCECIHFIFEKGSYIGQICSVGYMSLTEGYYKSAIRYGYVCYRGKLYHCEDVIKEQFYNVYKELYAMINVNNPIGYIYIKNKQLYATTDINLHYDRHIIFDIEYSVISNPKNSYYYNPNNYGHNSLLSSLFLMMG